MKTARYSDKTTADVGRTASGHRHFFVQRLTSLALIVLIPWMLLAGMLIHADLDTARAAIARPINTIGLMAVMVVVIWHAQLGLQVIIDDYVFCRRCVAVAQTCLRVVAAAAGLLSFFAILTIALRSSG